MSFRLEYPLNSGRLLVNGNDFYVGNSSSQKVQIARVDQIPSVTQYVHPTTKQCNYTYTHPSTKQCSWSPSGVWTSLRDQTYSKSSISFRDEHSASGAINLTGYCAFACRISGTYQIVSASSATARITVDGMDKVFSYINSGEMGTFNIDTTNVSFFETAFCKSASFNGVSFDPYLDSGRVYLTYPPASSYGGLTLTTGNIQTSMTVTYNLRQQVWGLKFS